ncbi:MAG: ATP-dependent 6-phosphofructokinase [Leptospiraceae bacterium]|nr:ATP-dependent 6-phosphofructokinase [Leptospiraceae bacterium]MCP5510999.1 ATP-dependent 6-phosphofructokinase [Leptospiraceae bacterium]
MINSKVETLGPCTIKNPAGYEYYTKEDSIVLFQNYFENVGHMEETLKDPILFEQSGPFEKIFFDPAETTAGIVTCGGLCPGINDVIRAIFMELTYRYQVKKVLGFRYGYEGLVEKFGHKPMELHHDRVINIHREGGSILSSSRGNQDPVEMVDFLVKNEIKILFCIGGDGTLRGAKSIQEEVKKRGLKIAVVGIPKTIDNDINMVHKTFGFSTAFAKAIDAISSAYVESKGAPNGIGLVKLMGRHSGFIAANAALASKQVNFVLIPEQDFDLEGPGGFLEVLKERILRRKSAVIIVAEGAGQKFVETKDKDASGNKKLGDIGTFLKKEITDYFSKQGIPTNLKYIDPSYIIRSVPANAEDSVFCGFLAQNAVHAAMAGKTGMVVGTWNNVFTNIPIDLAVAERKVLRPEKSYLWRAVLSSTGQPNSLKAKS